MSLIFQISNSPNVECYPWFDTEVFDKNGNTILKTENIVLLDLFSSSMSKLSTAKRTKTSGFEYHGDYIIVAGRRFRKVQMPDHYIKGIYLHESYENSPEMVEYIKSIGKRGHCITTVFEDPNEYYQLVGEFDKTTSTMVTAYTFNQVIDYYSRNRFCKTLFVKYYRNSNKRTEMNVVDWFFEREDSDAFLRFLKEKRAYRRHDPNLELKGLYIAYKKNKRLPEDDYNKYDYYKHASMKSDVESYLEHKLYTKYAEKYAGVQSANLYFTKGDILGYLHGEPLGDQAGVVIFKDGVCPIPFSFDRGKLNPLLKRGYYVDDRDYLERFENKYMAVKYPIEIDLVNLTYKQVTVNLTI